MALSKIKANSVDTTSNVTVNSITVGGQQVSSFTGMRNRVINGAMIIDQRASGTITASNAIVYGIDRWCNYAATTSKFTVAGTTASYPPGFTNAILITSSGANVPASSDQYCIIHRIEGYNLMDAAYGTVTPTTYTLSFWVRSSVTGTFGVSLYTNNSKCYVSTYVVNSANTWEYKTITIPGDTATAMATNNGLALEIRFSVGQGSSGVISPSSANTWFSGNVLQTSDCVNLMATSGATMYITGVQFERGSVATPFELRPYTTELQLCQRYYYKTQQTGNATSGGIAVFQNFTASEGAGGARFPVRMRATPTITNYDNNGNSGAIHVAASGNVSGVNVGWIDSDSWNWINKAAGWSSGTCAISSFKADAEL